METRKTPLQPDTFYHIYNRGINGQDIFFEEKNYIYFLQKMGQYISPYMDTYAYCLLANHFHLLIKAKSEAEIRLPKKVSLESAILPKAKPVVESAKTTSWLLSNAFASLFKSYALAINKRYGHTGGFFEEPFHRIEVDSNANFKQLIWYIHHNPEKHGLVTDFHDYPHSSYHSHLLSKATKLKREEVLSWFGDAKEYVKYHANQGNKKSLQDLIIEFD